MSLKLLDNLVEAVDELREKAYKQGLYEMLNELIEKIGPADFFDSITTWLHENHPNEEVISYLEKIVSDFKKANPKSKSQE